MIHFYENHYMYICRKKKYWKQIHQIVNTILPGGRFSVSFNLFFGFFFVFNFVNNPGLGRFLEKGYTTHSSIPGLPRWLSW